MVLFFFNFPLCIAAEMKLSPAPCLVILTLVSNLFREMLQLIPTDSEWEEYVGEITPKCV